MERSIDKRLLTVKETAFLLGISARSIYNGTARTSKNPFPILPVRIKGNIRFDIRDIETYLDSLKAK